MDEHPESWIQNKEDDKYGTSFLHTGPSGEGGLWGEEDYVKTFHSPGGGGQKQERKDEEK